ncbi:multicopper oxidase [Viridothelium virens]|uniref:Multicopper oxidase n=1 Tax=Viridothelium virens TaxID=1048519 RepID=A0A6A6HHQ1_VIRVR|nr:multicopper oxidase [Viridothelium virens]
MAFINLLVICLAWCLSIFGTLVAAQAKNCTLVTHDASFVPDIILRVTSEQRTIAGMSQTYPLVNGSYPGPQIELTAGQRTWIRVYNDMQGDNLTMHWHGLSQRVAPFADGTPEASQWPIPPSYFFDYEVAPDTGDEGTYFYHSHVYFQAATASGPLIVRGAASPYQYDEEIVVFVGDAFNKSGDDITQGLLANPFVWSGEATAILFNGHSGTTNYNGTNATSPFDPAVFNVQPSKTYLFRFIGGQALSLVTFGFEDHSNLTVVEADGAYTKPATTDHIQIGSGQRFSVLLTTKSEQELQSSGKKDFWIQQENRNRPASLVAFSVLSYDNSTSALSPPAVNPLSLPQDVTTWLEYTLQPVTPDDFPTAAEVTRRITITPVQVSNGSLIWAQNNLSWTEATAPVPYLVSIYENGESAIPNYNASVANYGWDPVSKAWPAKIGEVLEIIIVNDAGPSGGFDQHPFHFHGRHFWDIGSGNGTYDPVENEKKLAGFTPATRDTVWSYRYQATGDMYQLLGWRGLRVRVTDAGVWMFHCHILQHLIMGMATTWVFGDYKDIIQNPEMMQGYLTYGGDVYGSDSNDPTMCSFFD